MATKGKCSCLENSAPDEPIFVLVARDRLAPRVVWNWADAAEVAGVPQEKIDEARALAGEMMAWQARHPDRVKVPD